jgi:hypothetical protein
MNRMASICAMTLAAVGALQGQGARHPDFPPDLVSPAITVTGVDDKSIMPSLSDLSKLPQHTVTAADHGATASFEGVLLADVLAKVALPTGEKFHHTSASYYLLVKARDGYQAVFAWAELDATFMDKPIYLVTKRDGKPLSEKDGPFQLVAPGEKRAARWVHQVTALSVRPAN